MQISIDFNNLKSFHYILIDFKLILNICIEEPNRRAGYDFGAITLNCEAFKFEKCLPF